MYRNGLESFLFSLSYFLYSDIPALQLDEEVMYHELYENMYCANYTMLIDPKENSDLEKCTKIVSSNKGRKGCHASGIFMHAGNGTSGCYCSKDDCTKRSESASTLNFNKLQIYKLSKGKKLCII